MCWNKQFPWGLISNKAASCISAVLVEGGSSWVFLVVGVPRIFHLIQFLLCERLFFLVGTALGACFNILSTLFILIFHGRKVFWGTLLAG